MNDRAPGTPAPDTPAPNTPAPGTSAPGTSVPDTPVPDTPAPDTPAPGTSVPGTSVPATSLPDTPAADTSAPDTPAAAPKPATDGTPGTSGAPGAAAPKPATGGAPGVSGSRARILGRIRAALADAPEAPEVTRDYLDAHTPARGAVDLLAENLADYRALVHRTGPAGLPALVARLLAGRGARTVLVPPLLPADWLSATPESVVRVPDSHDASPAALDAVDSVVTGCALAIAETGTLVLDAAPDQGRRRITLVPDHHICVVRTSDQVVVSVPQALPRLDPTRPLTWISGPSATSDIELDRVEGVHGPRTLEVILVDDAPDPPAADHPG